MFVTGYKIKNNDISDLNEDFFTFKEEESKKIIKFKRKILMEFYKNNNHYEKVIEILY